MLGAWLTVDSWLYIVQFGYSECSDPAIMCSNVADENWIGWGPCAWVLISEIWPLSNRAYGIALGASSNWMCNFIVSQITPVMLEKFKHGAFIFYGILTFGGGLFVWLCVPETKRLTLEEMDAIFGSVGVAEAVRIPSLSSTFIGCTPQEV